MFRSIQNRMQRKIQGGRQLDGETFRQMVMISVNNCVSMDRLAGPCVAQEVGEVKKLNMCHPARSFLLKLEGCRIEDIRSVGLTVAF